MRNLSIELPVLIIFLVIGGCMANLEPREVSERFWTAVQEKNTVEIRKYISSDVSNNALSEHILPIDNVSLGKTVIDGDHAWVDTEVDVSADEPFTLPLKTVLKKENNQWKVDYDETVSPVSSDSSIARVVGNLSELSNQVAEELDRALEDIQAAIPEVQKEIEEIEENLNHSLPELRQRIEEIMQQLEEALKGKKDRQSAPGTTEI